VKFSIEKVIFKSADYYKGEGTPVEKEVKGGVEGFKKAIPEIVKG
jgi:CRISPR-associated protein Csm3